MISCYHQVRMHGGSAEPLHPYTVNDLSPVIKNLRCKQISAQLRSPFVASMQHLKEVCRSVG